MNVLCYVEMLSTASEHRREPVHWQRPCTSFGHAERWGSQHCIQSTATITAGTLHWPQRSVVHRQSSHHLPPGSSVLLDRYLLTSRMIGFVPRRVWYKLAVTVHRCLHHQASRCLSDYFMPVSEVPSRQRLWSARRRQPSVPSVHHNTFGSRCFSCRRTNSLELTVRWSAWYSCWLQICLCDL